MNITGFYLTESQAFVAVVFFLFMWNYVNNTFSTIKPSATINYITLGFKTLGCLEHLGTSRALGQLGYLSPLSSWGTLSLKTLEGTLLLAGHLRHLGTWAIWALKESTLLEGHLDTWVLEAIKVLKEHFI